MAFINEDMIFEEEITIKKIDKNSEYYYAVQKENQEEILKNILDDTKSNEERQKYLKMLLVSAAYNTDLRKENELNSLIFFKNPKKHDRAEYNKNRLLIGFVRTCDDKKTLLPEQKNIYINVNGLSFNDILVFNVLNGFFHEYRHIIQFSNKKNIIINNVKQKILNKSSKQRENIQISGFIGGEDGYEDQLYRSKVVEKEARIFSNDYTSKFLSFLIGNCKDEKLKGKLEEEKKDFEDKFLKAEEEKTSKKSYYKHWPDIILRRIKEGLQEAETNKGGQLCLDGLYFNLFKLEDRKIMSGILLDEAKKDPIFAKNLACNGGLLGLKFPVKMQFELTELLLKNGEVEVADKLYSKSILLPLWNKHPDLIEKFLKDNKKVKLCKEIISKMIEKNLENECQILKDIKEYEKTPTTKIKTKQEVKQDKKYKTLSKCLKPVKKSDEVYGLYVPKIKKALDIQNEK